MEVIMLPTTTKVVMIPVIVKFVRQANITYIMYTHAQVHIHKRARTNRLIDC